MDLTRDRDALDAYKQRYPQLLEVGTQLTEELLDMKLGDVTFNWFY